MKQLQLLLILATAFLVGDDPMFAGEPDSTPKYEPLEHYRRMDISGWSARVHRDLVEKHPELWEDVRAELENHFYRIKRRLPASAVKRLREVTFWIEYAEGNHPGSVYHPNRQWLVDHDMHPQKAECVEIAHARNFLDWSITQPYSVLHELAHAWHHQVLADGFGNKEISLLYERAQQTELYGKVLHASQKKQKSYAATDPMEYFAESTEAYFGTNDFYPFVKAELKQHDPEMFEFQEKVWQKAEQKE